MPETIWLARPKIFTNWSFIENTVDACDSVIPLEFSSETNLVLFVFNILILLWVTKDGTNHSFLVSWINRQIYFNKTLKLQG